MSIPAEKFVWNDSTSSYHIHDMDVCIRGDPHTKFASIIDCLVVLTNSTPKNASNWLSRFIHKHAHIKQDIKIVRINGNGKLTPVCDTTVIPLILASFVQRAYIRVSEKRVLIETLQLPCILPVAVRAETEIIHNIRKALACYESCCQYAVGKYRIDLYIIHERVAIECDEHMHTNYDPNAECSRQTFITSALNCSFFRFDPYDIKFCIFDIISSILKLLKSRD